MYEKIYNTKGEFVGIREIESDEDNKTIIEFGIDSPRHKRYLKDIELDPTCVIDNPPSQAEILEVKRQAKITEIDSKTKQLINSSTFKHPTKNVYFSGSYSAKDIWMSLVMLDSKNLLAYPYKKMTVDNSWYDIENTSDLIAIIGSLFLKHETIAIEGGSLKVEVKESNTPDEVLDERI